MMQVSANGHAPYIFLTICGAAAAAGVAFTFLVWALIKKVRAVNPRQKGETQK